MQRNLLRHIGISLCFPAGIIFSSCNTENKKEDEMYRSMELALDRSNQAIHSASFVHYKSLESKLADLVTAERASLWQPKVQFIKMQSDQLIKIIELMKYGIRNKGEDQTLSVINLKSFYQQIQSYKTKVFAVDSMFNDIFSKTIGLDLNMNDKEKNEVEFIKSFEAISSFGALAQLTRLENAVYNIENNLVIYCDYNCSAIIDKIDKVGILVGQSTNITEAGKEIEICAGVGAYSSAANPSILINSKPATVLNGQGTLKIKAADKPGKYIIPVIVTFTDENGRTRTIQTNLQYTVSDLH